MMIPRVWSNLRILVNRELAFGCVQRSARSLNSLNSRSLNSRSAELAFGCFVLRFSWMFWFFTVKTDVSK